MKLQSKTVVMAAIGMLFFLTCCEKEEEEPTYPQTTRQEQIPTDAIKMTPATDLFPPILHSSEWEEPVTLGPTVNTAGAEDSPFIPADRNELYFFFTPDVDVPVDQQIYDEVTGIYVSQQTGTSWADAQHVWLQDPVNVAAVNTTGDEGWPYITPDGLELWITCTYQGAAAIFRSKKVNDTWQQTELIVSQFAGEPTLDKEGNLYFTHHFFDDGKMIEADIYVAMKK